MEKAGSWGSAKTPEEREAREALAGLASENREQDLVDGLKDWHIEHLQEQAEEDPLTGLKNRRVFDSVLEHALGAIRAGAEHEQREHPLKELVLVYVDLDHFKRVNDTFGHAAGDLVLQKVAELLKGSIRAETDIAARLGGEELALLMPGASVEAAGKHAEELRAKIEQLVFDEYPELKVTASFGVVSSNVAAEAITLKKHADDALYLAKREGRNRVMTYSDI